MSGGLALMQSPLNTECPNNIALVEAKASFTYAEVERRTTEFASGLLGQSSDLAEARIAFLVPAGLDYVTVLHGIWRAGGIAIPLNVGATESEWAHCLSSTGVTRVVSIEPYRATIQPLCDSLSIEVSGVSDYLMGTISALPELAPERKAMIIFTSGTTSKPKGVVTTHGNIAAQITALVDAWAWQATDVIPLFLPLHHVHGIIAVLSCALWAGATVHVMPTLALDALCQQVANDTYSLFMAVPTIYVKLIDHLDAMEASKSEPILEGFANMRLNVSGSAACPVVVFDTWQELTGQALLERYGMTEIGMALSNPYEGDRRAGYVGQPLPGVDVCLIDEAGNVVKEEGVSGEIRIQGQTVFLEYWDNPEATAKSFVEGWFCTGDIGVLEAGYYRIMGRSSIDIIKSGGYKLSALEIENKLLDHPAIAEVAVLGIEDRTWGEAVAAVVVLKSGGELTLAALKDWCDGKLSAYKIPKKLLLQDSLPRNAMGKVTKPALKAHF